MTESAASRVIVLESVAPPADTTKFVDQVVRYAPSSVGFLFFSWRTALFGRFQVFHVHWPEYLVRGRWLGIRAVKFVLYLVFLARLRRQHVVVVRTVHNVEPHSGGGRVERWLLAKLDALVEVRVVLNSCTPSDGKGQTELIPHGDYREVLADYPHQKSSTGRIVFFGRIERYKGVAELIRLAKSENLADLEFRIVGRPTAEMREILDRELLEIGNSGASVSTKFSFVSDQEMVEEITAAEAVILPYEEMHNSGVVLVALSLGRPVILPRSCVTTQLAAEIGDKWIAEYEGPLTATKIKAAVEHLRARPEGLPALDERSWDRISDAYASLFVTAVKARSI